MIRIHRFVKYSAGMEDVYAIGDMLQIELADPHMIQNKKCPNMEGICYFIRFLVFFGLSWGYTTSHIIFR
jgi:hypothetical protein